jgi:hypothetical protein
MSVLLRYTDSDCPFGIFTLFLKIRFANSLNHFWRYQTGNQKPLIEEGQTTQWPKEKGQKDKQRSTKYTHKTKEHATLTSLKIWGELRFTGRVGSSCSTSDTRRVNNCICQKGLTIPKGLIRSRQSKNKTEILWKVELHIIIMITLVTIFTVFTWPKNILEIKDEDTWWRSISCNAQAVHKYSRINLQNKIVLLSWWEIQYGHHGINNCCQWLATCFLRVLRFLPPIKLTAMM